MNQVLFNRTMDVPTKEQREKVFNTIYAKTHIDEIKRLEGLDIIIKNVKHYFKQIQDGANWCVVKCNDNKYYLLMCYFTNDLYPGNNYFANYYSNGEGWHYLAKT